MTSRRASLRTSAVNSVSTVKSTIRNCLFNKNISGRPLRVAIRGTRHSYEFNDGTVIYDASGGASVASLGRRQKRVEAGVMKQMQLGLSYVPSLAFDTPIVQNLAQCMIASTDGKMSKAIFFGSGSEASEAGQKLTVQYHAKEKSNPQPSRTKFIARKQSYHGATLGALDLSGHEARKTLYRGILANNMHLLPPCNPYRNRSGGQTDEEYVQERKAELVEKITELGPETVAGFILEPVVGAALGCVPAVPGYLKAMREVCDEYDILLIFDEVMCGMGRTGYMHAWQQEDVVPDIQLLGKGLAAGFQAISGVLIGHKVAATFENGPSNGAFWHGQTFQNLPVSCAAAVAVHHIIMDDKLLENVREKGQLLERGLRKRLGDHRYVGDIRGCGLFWGLEFVLDKDSKKPFPPTYAINEEIYQWGLRNGIHVYPGAGSADGKSGDHIMISPAFDVTNEEIDFIVDRVAKVVEDYFDNFDLKHT
ncbi:PLP-dependent transferase [Decorospora gaudefroyi]|uniref:PLP-dependent transferase n=1 Tax=Decorospora gaudefroyi TaxID=184978 RepID=A0A6A5K748_9PLEO|nr:PLP-dependent transferase [Decorospora gaudefroyi]